MIFTICYASIFILFLCSLHYKGDNSENVCCKNYTTVVNGFFIILVLFSHLRDYSKSIPSPDSLVLSVVAHLGQHIVACFLFFSGYGIFMQVKKYGADYVNSMPLKRIFLTYLNFAIAVTFYLVFSAIGRTGTENSVLLKRGGVMLVLLGWESAGNSNWYVFVILILYLITYISFKFIKKLSFQLFSVLVLSFATMLVLSFLKGEAWYNTILCYSAGMFFCAFRDKIDKVLAVEKNFWLVLFIDLFITGLVSILNYSYGKGLVRHYIYNINAVTFAFFFVVLQYRFEFKSCVLKSLGSNLFGIYIIQRLPMMCLKTMIKDYYIYNLICVVLAIVLGILFNKLLKIIDRLFAKCKIRS